jgi:N-acetylneuraminate synthase
MTAHLNINGREIGPGHPVYVIAELSANHGQDYEQAARIVRAMKAAGADAVKVQTYTPDTLTIQSDKEYFQIRGGTLWDGRTLYDLYREAHMPWEWQPRLQALAVELGLDFFSTPFDPTAVAFLEGKKVPAYKIASFELVDLPLIRAVAHTGKPLIMSTGGASGEEIAEAVEAARAAGCAQLALLKCTSAYPALPEEMNLRTIPDLAARLGVVAGLSDHTLGTTVPVAAVSLGACIVEKHFTLSRRVPGPDAAFSLEPEEFKAMVEGIRTTEKALGRVNYGVSADESRSRGFRRSLFVVKDVKAGEVFTGENVRSIRPAHGLHTRHLPEVLGRKAAQDLERGTPLRWEHIVGACPPDASHWAGGCR